MFNNGLKKKTSLKKEGPEERGSKEVTYRVDHIPKGGWLFSSRHRQSRLPTEYPVKCC